MPGFAWLLDTNIISALVRDPHGAVFRAMADRSQGLPCTSIVVAAELEYGLRKSGSVKLRTQVERILAVLEVLPLEAPVEQHYGEIRHHLQQLGQPIGENDLFIAAHARALGLTLVTHNLREFERVPGLVVENWLDPT
jgi:tRNA(fMet)-specific endonuclease VapC